MSGVPLVPLVFAEPFWPVPFFRPFFAAPLPLLRRFADCPLTALVLTRAKVKSSQAWNISGAGPCWADSRSEVSKGHLQCQNPEKAEGLFVTA